MKTLSRIQLMLITLTFFTPNVWADIPEERKIKEVPGRTLEPSALFGPTLVTCLIGFDMFILFFGCLMTKLSLIFIPNHNARMIIYDQAENGGASVTSITITMENNPTANNTASSRHDKVQGSDYDDYDEIGIYETYNENEGYYDNENENEGYYETYNENENEGYYETYNENENEGRYERYEEEDDSITAAVQTAAVQLPNPVIVINQVSSPPIDININSKKTSSGSFVQFPIPVTRAERGSDKGKKVYSFI